MKEMAFELEWSIDSDGGLDRVDTQSSTRPPPPTPQRGRDYARPINQPLATRATPPH